MKSRLYCFLTACLVAFTASLDVGGATKPPKLVTTFDTAADLAAYDLRSVAADGQATVVLRGWTFANDGRGGIFSLQATNTSDPTNTLDTLAAQLGGSIVGRWRKISEGNRTVRTLAELDQLVPAYDGEDVDVQGFDETLIWGWRTFRFLASDTATTNAIHRAAITGGRWAHPWDGKVEMFGVRGDGTDEWQKLQAAHDVATQRGLPTILPGGKIIKLGYPLVVTSGSRIKGWPTRAWLDGAFSGSKGNTNGGIIRTPNALFPTWGEPLEIVHSNIVLECIGLLRNWPNGGSYTGPLLMLDDVSGVLARDLVLNATNHQDWAAFIRADNVHAVDIEINTLGQWGQDGWHIYGGTNHILANFRIKAGDDAVAVGSERNQRFGNIDIGPGVAISDASRAIAIFQATYSTTPPGPPTNPLQHVIVHDVIAHGGQRTNWTVVIEEYAGANNTHSAEPPRVVRDILLSDVLTTRGAHTNGGAGAIRIEGTEDVTISNSSTTNGNYSGISLNRTRGTTLRNFRNGKTIRTGSTAGSSGLFAYDNANYGLTIEGGRFDASDGLHAILGRGGTNFTMIGATVVGVDGKFGLWLDLWTNALVTANTFLGPQGIHLGTGVANAQIFGNVFDESGTLRINWNGANRNTYVEDRSILYPIRVYTPELYVGTQSVISNSAFAVESTTRGMRPPRMSTAQVDEIPVPELGVMAVDNGWQTITFHNGVQWRLIPGWPRGKLTVNSGGGATFRTDDGLSTPISLETVNSWPLLSTMYGDAPGFGNRHLIRRAVGLPGSMSAVPAGYDLGGDFFTGSINSTDFGIGETAIYGRTTEDWLSGERGSELVLVATPTNTTTRIEALRINVDFPRTNSLSIESKDGGGTWLRLAVTNINGVPFVIAQ